MALFLNSASQTHAPREKSFRWGVNWLKISALVALINYGFVLFHFSYPLLRDFYATYFPNLVTIYDPIKGITVKGPGLSVTKSTDGFWQIDQFFIAFFALEFLTRTFLLSRRKTDLTWFGAMLRRWYDIFLFLPFWQGWRILPVLTRLHKARLINLKLLLADLTYEPIAYFAGPMSEYMMVRLINQARKSVEQGEATRLLLQPQPYLHVNQINTVELITSRILELTIYKVLPQVQPNLEQLLRHNLESTIKQSDFYQMLQGFSPIELLPKDSMEQLANYLTQIAVESLATSYEDGKSRQIIEGLTQEFGEALRRELQDQRTQAELQSLLSDLLEELKLNYIQGGLKVDVEETLTEIARLRQPRSR